MNLWPWILELVAISEKARGSSMNWTIVCSLASRIFLMVDSTRWSAVLGTWLSSPTTWCIVYILCLTVSRAGQPTSRCSSEPGIMSQLVALQWPALFSDQTRPDQSTHQIEIWNGVNQVKTQKTYWQYFSWI